MLELAIPKKLYLDTNIVERYFKNAILASRRKIDFRTPFIFQVLARNETRMFISTFTLCELYEHLWKNYKISSEEISKITARFLKSLNVTLILNFSIGGDVLRWIRKKKLEAKDVIHLSISIKNRLPILSADENFVKRGKAIYDQIIFEKELRGSISYSF